MGMTHEMVVWMGGVRGPVGEEAGGIATTTGTATEIGETEAGYESDPDGFDKM
jgi:hypothetical protein